MPTWGIHINMKNFKNSKTKWGVYGILYYREEGKGLGFQREVRQFIWRWK